MTRTKDVRTYIEELEKTKEGRTEQVKEGLEIYISLWRKAMDRGVVAATDGVDDALAKIESAGGLYVAAGE
ncbi:MAG: hypothetical protein JRN06_07935 [Nitrososphaerota archaeon]|nr:hypothetical protein [Nitrososphaerota archaeon]MDG7024288.1 hypothetical protein [Nitrososphaerota archaeon]